MNYVNRRITTNRTSMSETSNTQKISSWKSIIDALEEKRLHMLWGPKTVQIEITNICNSRCKMCKRWQWVKGNKNMEGRFTFENIKPLLDDLKKLKVENILFSGGEPFLMKDFTKIILYLKELKIRPALFTNGSKIDKETCRILMNSGSHVCFSMDGSTAKIDDQIRGVKGFYERTIGNIRLMVNAKKRKGSKLSSSIGINSVIQKENASDMVSSYLLAKKLGVDYIRFGLVHGFPSLSPTPSQVKKIRQSIQTLKKIKSGSKPRIFLSPYLDALINHKLTIGDIESGLPAYSLFKKYPTTCFKVFEYCMIDAFGDVYPCTYAYFDNKPYKRFLKKKKKLCMGNIFKKRFIDVWNGKRYIMFREKINPIRIKELKLVCGQCDHFYAFKNATDCLNNMKASLDNLDKTPFPDVVHTYEFESFI